MTSDDQRMFAKWINAELDNYAEKFFSNRVIKKTKIYFHDQLDDKTILTICKGILSDYDNEKKKIKKLRKNARAFFTEGKKIPNGKHKFLSPSYKSNEYIAEDSDYLNNYRLGYAEFDIDDLKKAKNDKNYELMRVWLNDEHLNNLKIKEFFNTADFIGLKNIKNYRSQVSEKDQPLWDPNIFFH